MQISIFLAKIFSIYFLVISLPMILNPESFCHRAKAYMNNEAVMFLGGIFTLLLGILLILVHSIWVHDWRLMISVLAWLTFIKGIIHVLCPNTVIRMMQQMNNLMTYRIVGIACFMLAIYLGYHGF
jgi:hypothetical protein